MMESMTFNQRSARIFWNIFYAIGNREKKVTMMFLHVLSLLAQEQLERNGRQGSHEKADRTE